MQVRIRLFARQREIAGARQVLVEVAAGATIEGAWAALVALQPALAAGRPYVRFARNGEYAAPDEVLADGDEVACIPPVSGGAGEEAEPAAERVLELVPAPLPPDLGRSLADRLATAADGAV